MTKKTKAAADDGLTPPGEKPKLEVTMREDEKIGRTLARITLDPQTRNAYLGMTFGSHTFGDQHRPEIAESSAVMAEEITRACKGDVSLASRMFTSQAISLDTIFTEMARRAAENLGSYPLAVERYMRLALKAQAASRATLEALVRVHQPREQTVKHVHVNEGGQAVVADHFHAPRQENAKNEEQPHGQGSCGPALLSPDPLGNGVQIASDQGQAAMPPSRRAVSGRT